MHEHGFGETNGFACQALDPCPQRQMFTFDLLRVAFANGMSRGGEVALIDSGRIRVEVLQAKGLEQLLQLDENRIRATAKRIRQDYATQMVNRVPQPALMGFAPHKTPHFIDLRCLHAPHFDRDRVRTTALHYAGVDLGEAGRFFLIP